MDFAHLVKNVKSWREKIDTFQTEIVHLDVELKSITITVHHAEG